jgi:hypothetical protein
MITSFGGDEEEEESAAHRTVSKSNLSQTQKSEIEEKLSNLKRLKQNVVNLRASHSRSRSKSPVQHKTSTSAISFKKSFSTQKSAAVNAIKVKADSTESNSGSSTDSTDEEEKLKKYLQRRESRKYFIKGELISTQNFFQSSSIIL